ncbi:hypothetical protein Tco_0271541 [Tanacetum coccineum]
MENANPFIPAPPNRLRARITQELNELRAISAMIDSRLKNINHTQIIIPPPIPIEQLLNDFMNSHDVFEMDDLESDNESIDTPLISPFIDSDEDIDGDDLAFPCMIDFRKFIAYFDTFLPMNIITLLEDIGKFIVSDMSEVVMGRPFRVVTQLEYDRVKGLISFTKIFDTYIFRMPRTIPRLKNFSWSKVPPILVLSHRDLMSGLRYPHEKNKLMYKNCLNIDPEYQVDEDMKEWLTRGHVILDEESRKAHLLEDKQIPSVEFLFDILAFGKHWKEIHVTWAQMEKKQDKDATLQDFDGAWIYSAWRRHRDSF